MTPHTHIRSSAPVIFAVSFLLFLGSLFISNELLLKHSSELSDANEQSLVLLFAHSLEPFLTIQDKLGLQAELDRFTQNRLLTYANFRDPQNQLIGEAGSPPVDPSLLESIPIQIDSELLGTLTLGKNPHLYNELLTFEKMALLAALLALLPTLIAQMYHRSSLQQIRRLDGQLSTLLDRPNRDQDPLSGLTDSIDFLSHQLNPQSTNSLPSSSKTTNESGDQFLVLIFSTQQISDWRRHMDEASSALTLQRFEQSFKRMLRLYGGDVIGLDEERILCRFDRRNNPLATKQAVLFSMGILQSLAKTLSPTEGLPIPLSAMLFGLPLTSQKLGEMEFFQRHSIELEQRTTDASELLTGHLLVDVSLLDPEILALASASYPSPMGTIITAVRPALLKLWENQYLELHTDPT